VRFRLLGPVEVEVAGETLWLPRRRERCLLGVLLLEPNRVIPRDRLAELLWDGDPPERARRTIQSHISRLRALLATAGAQHDTELATVGDGYRMSVDPQTVDAHRFRALVEQAAETTDPDKRIDQLRAALDLWRGPPLDNAASSWLRDRLCADLEERRLTATEDLVSAGLAVRDARDVLPELARLAGAHPGRESLVELHMRALYQVGRKADALEAYAQTHTYLADEFGVDPGPALRELRMAILRGPPRAVAAGQHVPPAIAAGPATQPSKHVTPRQLPTDIAGFAGREGALRELDALLTGPGGNQPNAVAISAIVGTPGVGKTALALHWAHRAVDRFPDGQLYVNLRGSDPGQPPMEPADAVRGFLDALQVPPQRIPASLDAQAGLYRSLLAGRRMLVLLDDARDAAQVRPLLPGTAGCLVVVTSRDQLSSLVTTEAVRPLTLDLMTHAESRQLLERRLGAGRVAAEPEATDEVITRCARLPLALAIVAARAAAHPDFPIHELARELREAGTGLDALSDPDPAVDVRAALDASYRNLSAGAARLFRLLGLSPGPDITVPAAASLLGSPAARVRPLLAELTRACLLGEQSAGRYGFHDLLRAYAGELTRVHDTGDARRAATRRMLDFYLHTAHSAATLVNPNRTTITLDRPRPGASPGRFDDHDQALSWFAQEHRVLLAAIARAAAARLDSHAWQLAWTLSDFFERQGHRHDWLRAQQLALDAARRLADPLAQAISHRSVARTHVLLGSFDDAHPHLRHAIDKYRELGDRGRLARTHVDLVVVLDRQARHREGFFHARQALALCRAEGDRYAEAFALNAIGWLHSQLGEYRQALRHCRRALALQQRIGDGPSQAGTWDSLGYAHHNLGQHRQAARCYQRALDLNRDHGDRYHEAAVLAHLGDTHRAAGEPDAAREAWEQALAIFQELDRPNTDQIRAKLDQLAVTAGGRGRT
jgi:DNA-binding SARP family transcriptional activator/tetratricopeptide (TPR) repeat protein